ncbi:MAG: NAD(+) synthase [candidate division KSB1 bacterium]|nr:NAD(+) synthase [candidate division KSB1 bacterium]
MSVLIEAMKISAEDEVLRIAEWMRKYVFQEFRRRGGVVGVSGGIDSAVTLALAARALGPDKVTALFMPEKDSSSESQSFAAKVASKYKVEFVIRDITPTLEALGCYEYLAEAIRDVYPDYDASRDKVKLVLPEDLLDKPSLNVFSLVLKRNGQPEQRKLLSPRAYLEIVAASNMKQRTRMLNLYFHAEKRNYAVIGTANKNEHEQGFFVKYGDGGADLQPIRHLYKSQVYQLARYLEIPQEIIERVPTTDTYSAGSTQEEFYFRVPFDLLDKIWLGLERQMSARAIAQDLELTEEQVERVVADLRQKKRTTEYLRTNPVSLTS